MRRGVSRLKVSQLAPEELEARRAYARRKAARLRAGHSPEQKAEIARRAREYRKRPEVRERALFLKRTLYQTQAYKDKVYENGRRAFLKRKYGITVADYERMYATQNGKCAICGASKPSRGGTKPGVKRRNGWSEKTRECFPVDHDHVTGKVRGLICHACNIGLGWFSDDPDALAAWAAKAVEYLRKA